ncbi:MAG: SMC-Scp complex subunit ScpB, partial [bacterium]
IVFASPKPMRAVEIHDLLAEQGYTLKEIQDACDELIEFYRDRAGGFHLKYIKRMGYQFQTTPAAKSLMEKQFASRPRPLSRASLETLAVIAYRQKLSKGVTRAEVEFIRGVDAGSIFKTLVERNLLTCIGRKEIPGRPMMFGVTDEFLKIFQLGSINDLPPLESFQTPQDILDAANQKITAFEAEQEGVDTEQFIADEEYSENVRGEAEFNPLAADVPAYAPSIERKPEGEFTGLESEITAAEEEKFEAESAVSDEGESQADLIDVLNEGQVAWTASQDDGLERPVQGATAGEVITSVDAIDESEWGDVKPVEMTDNESVQSVTLETSDHQSDEALLNERNATTEVALPTGDSQPPRGGEVDQ